jgi:hypothetical protein
MCTVMIVFVAGSERYSIIFGEYYKKMAQVLLLCACMQRAFVHVTNPFFNC